MKPGARPTLGLLLLLVAGSALADHHAAGSPPRQQAIIDACTRTNQDYQFHRDRGNAEAYGALFTEDAEFALQKPLKGRGEITAAMEKRFAERASRHFINVVQLDVTGLDTAEETGARAMALDGSDPKAVAALFDGLERAPDVVVYNPSARVRGPIAELDPEAVRRAVEISFWTQPAG